MPRKVIAAEHEAAAYEPAEVDLWADDGGGKFETIEMVRSVTREVEAAFDKAAESLGDTDETVELLAAAYDKALKPVAHRRKASKIIIDRYKADKLAVSRVEDLLAEIVVAARPT